MTGTLDIREANSGCSVLSALCSVLNFSSSYVLWIDRIHAVPFIIRHSYHWAGVGFIVFFPFLLFLVCKGRKVSKCLLIDWLF